MRAALGRADLVRFAVDLPPDRVARAAALLGFDAPASRSPGSTALEIADQPLNLADLQSAVAEPADAARAIAANAAPVPLWRFETIKYLDDPEPPAAAPAPDAGLTEADLKSPEHSLFATPSPLPLTPWSRLWPLLHTALRTSSPGREPDVPAIVRSLSRGEIVPRIPRIPRRAWSGRASVWIDRSARLIPFWSDQSDVCRRLRRICGRSGFDVRVLDGLELARLTSRQPDLLADFRPDPATPVLVLGDLGGFGSPADRSLWCRTARRLLRADVRITALVPSPPSRWDALVSRLWSAIPWERGRLRCGSFGARSSEHWQERASHLLTLASPAAFVQPGLLRALRRLLPASQADASTEVDAWLHRDVRASSGTGMVLHAEASMRRRERFAVLADASLKGRVSDWIGAWHKGLPRELLRAETLVWLSLRLDKEAPPPGDPVDAISFARKMEATALRGEGDGGFGTVVTRYERALLGSMPASIYEVIPGLKVVWAAAYKGVEGAAVPAGLNPSELFARLSRAGEDRDWSVRQVGGELVISPSSRGGAWPSHVDGAGSPIAWLLAARPYVWVTRERDGARTQHGLQGGLSIPLVPGEGVTLCTDRCEVTLKPWVREPWAVAAGRDWFGLWAAIHVRGVIQRFRWIPPGRFRMGSPEGEAGRWDAEGPQHMVTWTKGRWLADTPVTQALYEAVMGKNPSRFKTPDRPVEQVSWDDCKVFLEELNKLVPGLEARLPSEAEWEHACRAGTETATWLGDLEIVGENNAPLLDFIAWYGGNSGDGFELAEYVDSSKWPNKQYDHVRAGTRSVATKVPNPLGMYDMLGNVFEWCMDFWGTYTSEDKVNPAAYDRSGSYRVVRGGSWYRYARAVRAAFRGVDAPGNRHALLGFRVARDPAPGRGKTQ